MLALADVRHTIVADVLCCCQALSNAITLPESGLDANQPTLTVNVRGTTTGFAASIDTSPVVQVGAMASSALTFTPPAAGKATAIGVGWTYDQRLLAGDVLTLELPGFTGEDGTLQLSGSVYAAVVWLWRRVVRAIVGAAAASCPTAHAFDRRRALRPPPPQARCGVL